MATSLAKKLGIKPGARARFIHAPPDVLAQIGDIHLDIAATLSGKFDYIHAFVKSEAALNKLLPKLYSHLKERGTIWISWPKGGQLQSSLGLPRVIKIAYDHGLVESKTIGVNSVWSAIKLTRPRKGKVYKNSYGKLRVSA
jgi:hypothetical protein